MIDFRYHLVSIIAVFLALAIGIAIGTTALNGAVLNDLQGRVDGLLAENRGLERRISTLDARRSADEDFASAVAPVVVADRLAGRDVVVVAVAGAREEDVELVRTGVASAGGSVTGSVRLAPGWGMDGEAADAVDDLVVQALPAGVALPDGDPWDRAAALLAAALVDPVDGVGALPQEDVSAVVEAFRSADLLQLTDDEVGPGTLAVVVGPPAAEPTDAAPSPSPADPAAPRLAALALALDRRGEGTVVAGGPTGVVEAVRSDAAVRQGTSTVAPLDGTQGAVAVVLALAEQAEGEAGQYGAGDGAESAVPDLAVLAPTTESALGGRGSGASSGGSGTSGADGSADAATDDP